MDFRLSPRRYLWGIRLDLPEYEQLAALIAANGGRKTIDVFGPRDTPVPCNQASDPVVGIPADRALLVLCTSGAPSAEDVFALSSVSKVRITLKGDFRQVWLRGVVPIERDLADAGYDASHAPRPPPPPPPLSNVPPASPPPPDRIALNALCDFTVGASITAATSGLRTTHEPCGISRQACCAAMHENCAQAFLLNDAGCCDLLYFAPGTETQAADASPGNDRHTERSGVGRPVAGATACG